MFNNHFVFHKMITFNPYSFICILLSTEEADGYQFNEECPRQLNDSKQNTKQVLFCIQSMRLDRLASNLYEAHLDHQGEDQDDEEHRVVADVLEHIHLIVYLPRINPVEQLHEHKSLKDKRMMQKLLCFLIFVRCLDQTALAAKQSPTLNLLPPLHLLLGPVQLLGVVGIVHQAVRLGRACKLEAVVRVIVYQPIISLSQKDQQYQHSRLIDCVPKNVPPHERTYQGSVLGMRLLVQQLI